MLSTGIMLSMDKMDYRVTVHNLLQHKVAVVLAQMPTTEYAISIGHYIKAGESRELGLLIPINDKSQLTVSVPHYNNTEIMLELNKDQENIVIKRGSIPLKKEIIIENDRMQRLASIIYEANKK